MSNVSVDMWIRHRSDAEEEVGPKMGKEHQGGFSRSDDA